MPAGEIYEITICVTVTDVRALKNAAIELAEAIEVPGWQTSLSRTEDQLLMLVDPGALPGVDITRTCINRKSRNHQ
jgi:hypothetical protein